MPLVSDRGARLIAGVIVAMGVAAIGAYFLVGSFTALEAGDAYGGNTLGFYGLLFLLIGIVSAIGAVVGFRPYVVVEASRA